jgi:hypothetical protein
VSALSPDRPDKVEGRALSPRPFRHFGIEAVMLGPAVRQEGLLRREGVAVWRRLEPQALVFDRVATQAGAAADGDLLAVRVVVATTPARDRALRVPAVGERAARVLSAASEPPPTGWLLLVDEGPGETWLYLADEDEPAEVLAGFIGRRGRTDFARARRRSRLGGLGSAGIFAGLVLIFYSTAFGIGVGGQVAGAALAALSVVTLIRARPR